MTPSVYVRRRLAAALVLLLALCGLGAGALVLATGESTADEGAAPLRFEGWSGAQGGRLIGAAALTGEIWAIDQQTPGTAPRPFLLRYTTADGWRPAETAVDENGQPYGGGALREGRVTDAGGVVVIADDGSRPEGAQRIVMARDPGQPIRVLPPLPDGLLLPRVGSSPAEALSDRVIAARDAGGATEAFVGIQGRALQTGIGRWAAGRWTREPLCVAPDAAGTPPTGCARAETLTASEDALAVVALGSSQDGGSWALAKASADSGRGLVLFERVDDGTPRWRLHELGEPLFADAATPARNVADVAPLGAQALTVTAAGVWIDGSFRFLGEDRDVTLYLSGGDVTSWCDGGDSLGALCDEPLGVDLQPEQQSQAWTGGGPYGARVIGSLLSNGGRQFYATLEGTSFVARPSFSTVGARIAFTAPDEGWIGDVHVTRQPWTSPLAAWSVPLRRPVTAIVGEPGKSPGDIGARALAVGNGGSVMRYTPGQGWDSEGLLAAGGVATPNLRGVAWPTADFAYAVGDDGAMWRWRRVTDLWEPDPAAPFDFFGQLTGIAFQPGNADRGYVVGRAGVLMRYGKSWEPEQLPPEVMTSGPLGGPADLTSVAFAGSQALVAAGRQLLANDGSGWRVDSGAQQLIEQAGPTASIVTVSGLPDGGAVAAGNGLVLERDAAGSPWRASAQAPAGTVVAVAAFRENGTVRALASLSPADWPLKQDVELPVVDPQAPPPRLPAFTLPGDGYLLRETATGWRDEQRTALRAPRGDGATKSDPILALLADASGRGWAVGGWNSSLDSLGRGIDPTRDPLLARMETSSVSRYDPAGPTASANVQGRAVETPAGPIRLAVGGGARCSAACADVSPLGVAPDRALARALALAGQLHDQPNGPRAFLYTGGRAAVSGPREQQRFAELMRAATLPLLPAIADGEAADGSSLAYEEAFGSFPAPLGDGAALGGLTPADVDGAAPAAGRARTHYAADSGGAEGTVRIVVIDNATGSLAARDGAGNPQEDQRAWLVRVLADAKSRGIASIVVGNRPLNPTAAGAASDADDVARILRDGGASAYVYEGSKEQRAGAIPAGSGEVPAFSSGTLSYRLGTGAAGYSLTGLLMLELDAARRDPGTGRAPVRVRLIPAIEDLALEAVDGRLLNRSQPALFRGLGRRPRSGDLEDQYIALPTDPCTGSNRCPDRIDPEVRFMSSDPDIADFVRVDRSSPNPRKPYVDPSSDKVVADATSGLLCAFNAGTTTVTIESGGLSYSTTVTVRDGSVLRPCGTMPLDPRRFPSAPPSRPAAVAPPPPANQPPPDDDPPPVVPPPPPPVVTPVVVDPPVERATPRAEPRPEPRREPEPQPNPVPVVPALPALLPLAPLPPPPTVARPIPPSGTAPVSVNVPVAQPVAQVERQREEEEALEQSQAYVRVSADHEPGRIAVPLAALVLLAALGMSAIRRPRRDRGYAYADDVHAVRTDTRITRERSRRYR